MLRTVYAMLTNGTHYQDNEVDYEAINVQHNAPRRIKMLRKHRSAPCSPSPTPASGPGFDQFSTPSSGVACAAARASSARRGWGDFSMMKSPMASTSSPVEKKQRSALTGDSTMG